MSADNDAREPDQHGEGKHKRVRTRHDERGSEAERKTRRRVARWEALIAPVPPAERSKIESAHDIEQLRSPATDKSLDDERDEARQPHPREDEAGDEPELPQRPAHGVGPNEGGDDRRDDKDHKRGDQDPVGLAQPGNPREDDDKWPWERLAEYRKLRIELSQPCQGQSAYGGRDQPAPAAGADRPMPAEIRH